MLAILTVALVNLGVRQMCVLVLARILVPTIETNGTVRNGFLVLFVERNGFEAGNGFFRGRDRFVSIFLKTLLLHCPLQQVSSLTQRGLQQLQLLQHSLNFSDGG